MTKSELFDRINNPSFGHFIYPEFIKFHSGQLIGQDCINKHDFTRLGLMNTLLEYMPQVKLFLITIIFGEIIILTDVLPDKKTIELANQELLNIVPVCVKLEIHELEFEPYMIKEDFEIRLLEEKR